jgi:hypothetical protein
MGLLRTLTVWSTLLVMSPLLIPLAFLALLFSPVLVPTAAVLYLLWPSGSRKASVLL